ncbi:hypothetical protein H7F51_16515 [Novosphingobium flavum]|uniref:Cupin type-1 domain-containing protein n=1 Tax=Novosphingobium flavum TaxID=1778672 RepID=A0A7X1KMY2_9SPHN|nr:hypothetical protein [Novosphingobium flavum]MBC2667124.1 hypothetical protein [Novosphingobium flavum]
MNKPTTALAAMAMVLPLSLAPAIARAQAAEAAPRRDAVFIEQGDFAKALAARASGKGMSAVGAVRAGNDRINVDVLRRDNLDELPTNHKIVTEIYYILEGGGDFATGGKMVDPKPMITGGKPVNPASIGPSEKSEKVIGASTRHVQAGDVVMIPPGVVHNFTRLDGHVTYMVVRVNPGYEKGK